MDNTISVRPKQTSTPIPYNLSKQAEQLAEHLLKPENHNDEAEKRIESLIKSRSTWEVLRGLVFCQQVDINDIRRVDTSDTGTAVWFAGSISLADDSHMLEMLGKIQCKWQCVCSSRRKEDVRERQSFRGFVDLRVGVVIEVFCKFLRTAEKTYFLEDMVIALVHEASSPLSGTVREEARVPIVGRMEDKILSFVGIDLGRVLVRMHALLHVLQDNEVVHCFSKQALMIEYSLACDIGVEDL